MSDWKSKIKNKKKPFILSVNNLTPSNLYLKSENLIKGKHYKDKKFVSPITPYNTEEIGLYENLEGEWIWRLEDDSSHEFKMYISSKKSNAAYQDPPPTASWTVEVQQEWDTPIPHIVLIFSRRDGNSSSSTLSPITSTSSLPPFELDQGESESTQDGKKKKRKSKKSKKDVDISAEKKKDEFSNSFKTISDSDSEEIDQPRKNRISLIIKDRSKIKVEDDNIQDLRSAISMLSLGSPVPKNSFINKKNDDIDELMKTNSKFSEEGEHLGKMRESIIFHNDEREKRLAHIPETAEDEFKKAIKHLNSGNFDEASAFVNSALSQINEQTFNKESHKLKNWCIYSQIISLLCEMQRLENEKLFKQRALLSKFVAQLSFKSLSNLEHILISLRMGINRNLEIGNYNTASELLNLMSTLDKLPENDKRNIQIKKELCKEKNFLEKYPPVGIDSENELTINGKPFCLCLQAMRLVREKTHLFCEYCEATFSELNRSKQSNCLFCFSALKSISS